MKCLFPKRYLSLILIIGLCFACLCYLNLSTNIEHDHLEQQHGRDYTQPCECNQCINTIGVSGFSRTTAADEPGNRELDQRVIEDGVLKDMGENETRRVVVEACYKYNENGAVMLNKLNRKRNNCDKFLPRALVVGVKKCGTKTLQKYLSLHPTVSINGEIYGPKGDNITEKELNRWKNPMRFSTPEQLPMYSMPGYIMVVSASTFASLKRVLDPDVKFIIIIRDPFQRLLSEYTHKINVIFKDDEWMFNDLRFAVEYRGDVIHKTFQETLFNKSTGAIRDSQSLVSFGRYIEGIRKLLSVFDRNKLLIIDGHAFVKDPYPVMLAVEKFLSLPKFYKRDHFKLNPETGFYCANVPERPHITCADASKKGRPHPEVDPVSEKMLRDYYRPYNLALKNELGLDFPWLQT